MHTPSGAETSATLEQPVVRWSMCTHTSVPPRQLKNERVHAAKG